MNNILIKTFVFLLFIALNLNIAFGQTAAQYYQLGNQSRLKGQFALAIDYFDQAIAMDSLMAIAYTEKGYCYVKLKKYAEALQAFDRAVVLGEQDPLLFLNRGWTFFNIGEKSEACRNWQMCEQLGYSQVEETLIKYCRD